MGSKSVAAGVGAPSATERVVGTNNRNVGLMADALAGYEVTAATSPDELTPVLSGALDSGESRPTCDPVRRDRVTPAAGG